MKKVISIISVLLILVMMMATPVSVSAATTPDYKRGWSDTFTANKLTTAPVIDGKVSEAEYGKVTSSKTQPNHWHAAKPLGTNSLDGNLTDIAPVQPSKDNEWGYLMQRTSAKLDTWFAYDDKNIYIAYYQLGGAWDGDDADTTVGNAYNEYHFRNNYKHRIGLNMEDASDLLELDISMPNFDENGIAKLNAVTDNKGIKFSFTMGSPSASVLYENAADFLVDAVMSKTLLDGTPLTHINSKGGQYIECVEIVLDKAELLKAYNEIGGTDYEEFPNGMWVYYAAKHYAWGDEKMGTIDYQGNTCWFGKALTAEQKAEWGTTFQYFPDLVVFGEKVNRPEATTAPTTTAPVTTAPTTTAPTTTAPATSAADDVTTAAPAVTTAAPEAEGGCGGMITFGGAVLVATLGTCAVVVEKKKRR